jgi:hypothetical protein
MAKAGPKRKPPLAQPCSSTPDPQDQSIWSPKSAGQPELTRPFDDYLPQGISAVQTEALSTWITIHIGDLKKHQIYAGFQQINVA